MKAKSLKMICVALCAAIVLSGCQSMNNKTKAGLIGGGGGAAIGALIGNLVSGKSDKGKGTAIGAAIGAAVGGGAGVAIGHRMDKAADAAKAVENATVETITDANNLTAVKVTFDSGILFATNKYDLNNSAKTSLEELSKVLKEYNDADVAIYGHTDSSGSDAINNPLSVNRANSVASYLKSLGVADSQIKSVEGKGSTEPVADNNTAEGKSKNRRVEIYMYASEAMINAANNGTLK